jgi:hypothetical protein
LNKIFLFLFLLNVDSIAKEKLTGMLGANLGDNVIQAIGKENYSKFEVNYDPRFKKDYQQFEYLTSDNYAVQIFSERKSKKIVYIANVFIIKNKQECIKRRDKDIVAVQKEFILPLKKGQEVGTFGITNKDVIVFGDKEMIVNFSCITIPNADPEAKDQYRFEILTRKFNTFLFSTEKK